MEIPVPNVYFQDMYIYIYKQICRYMKIFEKGGLGIWTFYDIFGTSRNSIRE